MTESCDLEHRIISMCWPKPIAVSATSLLSPSMLPLPTVQLEQKIAATIIRAHCRPFEEFGSILYLVRNQLSMNKSLVVCNYNIGAMPTNVHSPFIDEDAFRDFLSSALA